MPRNECCSTKEAPMAQIRGASVAIPERPVANSLHEQRGNDAHDHRQ